MAHELFDEIKIGLATDEQIRGWSFGEVKKPRNNQLPDSQA